MTESKNKFYLHGGKTFSSLKGLAKELGTMSSDLYEHHVNKHKNDFHNWVVHSLKKEELGKKIEGQITKIELELAVLRHLIKDNEKGKNPSKKPTFVKTKP